MTIIQGASVV